VNNSNSVSTGVGQGEYSDDVTVNNINSVSSDHGLSKIALGALIGATIGGIVAALTLRENTERINQAVRDLGKTAKSTADSVSNSAQRVGDAVNSLADNVSDTTKEVNEALISVTTSVGGTLLNTMSTVKGTAAEVNETVKTAVGTVKEGASGAIHQTTHMTGETPDVANNGETLYKLIPVGQNPTEN
jgi:gas vesicle protein